MRTATPSPPYCIPARTAHQAEPRKTGFLFGEVAEMHRIPFSQLQRAIAAGGELQTRSEAHEAEMVLTIAE